MPRKQERTPTTPPEIIFDSDLEKFSDQQLEVMIGQLKPGLDIKYQRYYADGEWDFGDALRFASEMLEFATAKLKLNISLSKQDKIFALHKASEALRQTDAVVLHELSDEAVLRYVLRQLPGDPESTEAEGE